MATSKIKNYRGIEWFEVETKSSVPDAWDAFKNDILSRPDGLMAIKCTIGGNYAISLVLKENPSAYIGYTFKADEIYYCNYYSNANHITKILG